MLAFENYNLKNVALAEARYTNSNTVTKAEDRFKKDLNWLLTKQGYNRYKKRLEAFNIRLLFPGDSEFDQIDTAAISFDDMTVYVNSGMLDMDYYNKNGEFRDAPHFNQMSMLIRHELSHNLLMHQVRMVKKLADKFPEMKLKTSGSLHEMLNILEDFEISNKRYTQEDKDLVRHTYLNGQFISGLVTEDHRAGWKDLSLEEMYDKIKEEIEEIYQPGTVANKINKKDMPFGALANDKTHDGNWDDAADYKKLLTQASAKIHTYKNPKEEADVYDYDELMDQINYIKSVNQDLGKSVETIANNLKSAIIDDPNTPYNNQDIENMIKEVQNSKFDETVKLHNPQTNTVICDDITTPEEKLITVEILNVILGKTPYNSDFAKWKAQIEKHIDPNEFSEQEIQELIDILKNKKQA